MHNPCRLDSCAHKHMRTHCCFVRTCVRVMCATENPEIRGPAACANERGTKGSVWGKKRPTPAKAYMQCVVLLVLLLILLLNSVVTMKRSHSPQHSTPAMK